MTIPADVLERTGYRLPTEAEWEYACRAGAVTSRYYGVERRPAGHVCLVSGNVARTTPGRAAACCPTTWGLFDMLGNVYEWCQERPLLYRPDQAGTMIDNINTNEYVA